MCKLKYGDQKMKIDNLLAGRSSAMNVSVIREILKVVSLPGTVSLAGGIPAPESFPMEIMRERYRNLG